MNGEDIGYDVESNWSALKEDCLFPRYYLDD